MLQLDKNDVLQNMNHFYTMNEAAELLGIDRKTLRTWLRKANITGKSSPIDRRAVIFSESQLTRLQATRAPYLPLKSTQRSAISPPKIPHTLPPKSEQLHKPPKAITSSTFPKGYISWGEWARIHNIPESTVQTAIRDGRLPTTPGPWKHGRTTIQKALDATYQQTAYDLWHNSDRFQTCEHCPDKHSS